MNWRTSVMSIAIFLSLSKILDGQSVNVVTTPSANQTITQPSGTTLSVNNLSTTGTFTLDGFPLTTSTQNGGTLLNLGGIPSFLVGSTDTGVGGGSLANGTTTGVYNTAFGSGVMISSAPGSYNTAIGADAMLYGGAAVGDVAIGAQALYFSSGSFNVAVGTGAGLYTQGYGNNTTSSGGVYIGSGTTASADGLNNEIVIGENAIGNGTDTVTLGNQYIAKTILRGNVGIGTTSPGADLSSVSSYQSGTPVLEVSGDIVIAQGTGAGIIFQDGTIQTTAYAPPNCPVAELHMPGLGQPVGGDYAEVVNVSGNRSAYEPGDVLAISPAEGSDITKSTEPYSTLVAGIYSTKPGVIGRRQLTDPKLSTTEVPMAMVGIVPTKVTAENGPIRRGDLLVSSSTAGYAMKGTNRSKMIGAVLGKALGSLDSGTGVVEVLVSLQ
jgi:hypothetical protein